MVRVIRLRQQQTSRRLSSMWIVFAVLIIMGILWYRWTCIKQRREHIKRWGSISALAYEVIEELMSEYPNHKIMKDTEEEFTIHCKGTSHNFLLFLGYTPSGVFIRVDYRNVLGVSKVVQDECLPHEFNVYRVKMLLIQVM